MDELYFDTSEYSSESQITYNGVDEFSVRTRDGYDMSNHPVVEVSWYGAVTFCNYYGFRLPTEWEWQAVADFDGTFTYGCGTTIDHTKANYDMDNPLNLSDEPYTSPVAHYPSFGYGMNDMAGNVLGVDGQYLFWQLPCSPRWRLAHPRLLLYCLVQRTIHLPALHPQLHRVSGLSLSFSFTLWGTGA